MRRGKSCCSQARPRCTQNWRTAQCRQLERRHRRIRHAGRWLYGQGCSGVSSANTTRITSECLEDQGSVENVFSLGGVTLMFSYTLLLPAFLKLRLTDTASDQPFGARRTDYPLVLRHRSPDPADPWSHHFQLRAASKHRHRSCPQFQRRHPCRTDH